MNFLEKDLEEIVFECRSVLEERGLKVPHHSLRQLKIGNYGRADIVSISSGSNLMFEECYHNPTVTIFELKQDKISVSTFLQAIGYCKGIHHYLTKRGSNFADAKFKIVLIGKSIDKSSQFIYLTDLVYGSLDVEFYTYSYNYDGIAFKNERGYSLSDHGL